MSAESNVEFVKDLFAAFGRGDIDHFIDAHAVDAVTEFRRSVVLADGWVATTACSSADLTRFCQR
jgi:ketosteroid isomerase-like protein